TVGDEELNERGHYGRDRRQHVHQRIVWQDDVLSKVNEDQHDGRQRDETVNETPTQKNARPVREIAHRLGEQGIDLAFPNIGGDLKVVIGRHDEVADQDHEQIIINHRPVVVPVQFATALLKNGGPEKDCSGQGYQPEQRAQKIIPAIHKRVLEPDVKN